MDFWYTRKILTYTHAHRWHRTSVAIVAAGMVLYCMLCVPAVQAQSSWSPTLLVNTEAFQVIDDSDTTANISVRFGSTVNQSIAWNRTINMFRFSSSISVLGVMSGSRLRVDGNADIQGALALTGTLRTDSNITINDDADSNNAILTFGNVSGNQTLTYINAGQRFQLSRGLSVLGIVSGSLLRVDGIAAVHGALSASGTIRTDANLTLNDDADANDVVLTFGSDTANETLSWINASDRFQFSDDVLVSGTLLVTNAGSDIPGNYQIGISRDANNLAGLRATNGNGLSVDIYDGVSNWSSAIRFGLDANTYVENRLRVNANNGTGPAIQAVGAISGTTIRSWGNAPNTFSGAVITETSFSGASFFGAGLGSCSNGTTDKLLYNPATGRFSCGTDQTGGGSGAPEVGTASFSGATLRLGDARYVRKAGDTMTGALTIDLQGTTAGTGLILREKAYFASGAVLSGTLMIQNLQNTATPTQAPAGMLKTYSQTIAGRPLLQNRGQFGSGYALQPALFSKMVMALNTGGGTTVNGIGTTVTNDTTVSHPAADQVFGYMTNFATAATLNDTAGTSSVNTTFFRGSVGVANGFFFSARVGVVDTTSIRVFTGLANQTIATMVTADNPAGHYAGFQFSTNRGDTTWQLVTKDNTTQNVVNTNVAFTANNVYQLSFNCTSTCTTISWQIDNLTTGTRTTGSTSSNLPGGSTALRLVHGVSTLTTVAKNYRMQTVYTESDR